jgi:putative tryptophan/tyrosine transport system substrate-binding protein
MTGWLRYSLLVVLLAAGATTSMAGAAEKRVLIVREDAVVSRQASELLSRELIQSGWVVAEATLGLDRSIESHVENEQALIALGSRAFVAAIRHAGGKPVVAALLSQSALDDIAPTTADRWSIILLDQPVERWINLIHSAFPAMQQVGMLVGPASQRAARLMERRMADRRLTLNIEQVYSSEEVVLALEHLLPRMGVLLALPDPVAHNRNSVQPLLLTTYRAGIPVLAYSEAYLQAGAVLALYSTVPQIVTQVVETLQQFNDGRVPPNTQSPRYFTVGVNSAVARSLGLSLPASEELNLRLRNLGQ